MNRPYVGNHKDCPYIVFRRIIRSSCIILTDIALRCDKSPLR